MQSDGNSFWWDYSCAEASKDEDNILDQIYKNQKYLNF